MSEAIVDLTASLYDFVVSSEDAVTRSRARLDARRRQLSAHAHQLAERFQVSKRDLREDVARKVDDAAEQLRAMGRQLNENRPCIEDVRERWRGLGQSYEALREEIHTGRWEVPQGVRLERVKPQNYWRNLFHVHNGVVSVLLCEYVFPSVNEAILLAAGVTALFLSLDLARRFSPAFQRFLINGPVGSLARAHEHYQVPSSTWFALATLIGLLSMPMLAVEIGVLALALGDPVAAIVGKRWGRVQVRGRKTLEGAAAFVVAAGLSVAALLLICHPGMGYATVATVSVAAGVAGAITEVLTDPVDDNFSIPLVVGVVAALLL